MSLLRLHSPGIILLLWAALWAIGVRGDGMIVIGLTATGIAAILHSIEHHHRRARRGRQAPHR